MNDTFVTINTWDILYIVIGVVLFVLLLMLTQHHQIYFRMGVAGLWLTFVVATIMLGGAESYALRNEKKVSRVVNLINLGMSLTATLYEVSVIITRSGAASSPTGGYLWT